MIEGVNWENPQRAALNNDPLGAPRWNGLLHFQTMPVMDGSTAIPAASICAFVGVCQFGMQFG